MTDHKSANLFAQLFSKLIAGEIIDALYLLELSQSYDFYIGNVIIYEDEAKQLGILDKWKTACEG